MSKSLVLTTDVKGYWLAEDTEGYQFTKRYGDSGEPSGAVNFTNGVGDGMCNTMYRKSGTLAAAANFDLDLKGGTGELDVLKYALSFVKVRYIRLIITNPATGLTLKIGPQNQTNGWQGPFPVVTANGFAIVSEKFEAVNSIDGWAVDATHKILRLNNPSAASVNYLLEILGTDA